VLEGLEHEVDHDGDEENSDDFALHVGDVPLFDGAQVVDEGQVVIVRVRIVYLSQCLAGFDIEEADFVVSYE
jgi:hypothetical protein